jgi:hypothetical protein
MILNSPSGGYEEFCLLGNNAVWSVESKWTFGGTCRLRFEGRRISQARNQVKQVTATRFSTVNMEATCSAKRRLSFNRLHDAIPQKTENSSGIFV